MSELSVYDLNTREAWQELLDYMQSALGLPSALLDPENIILQSSGDRNQLGREIRSRAKAKPVICGQSQQFMAKMARTQKTSVVDICEAGMVKLVVPLFQNQDYLGSITTCGAMLPEMAIETFLIEKATGMGKDTIDEMAEQVPTVQSEQLKQLAEDTFQRVKST